MNVITRWIIWIISIPLLCLSALLFLIAVMGFIDAPRTAEKKQHNREALLRRAEWTDRYIKTAGHLPTAGEFKLGITNIRDGGSTDYELLTSHPDGFHFPPWPTNKLNYAIQYWAGEWLECYDSNTRSTTLDEVCKTSFWIKDDLWPLGASALIGLPPAFVLIILKRKRKERQNRVAVTGW